jgi:hypothetical protein
MINKHEAIIALEKSLYIINTTKTNIDEYINEILFDEWYFYTWFLIKIDLYDVEADQLSRMKAIKVI